MKHGGYVVLQRISTVLRHAVADEASPAAAPRTSGAGVPRSWRARDGHGDHSVKYAFEEPEIVDLVRRAVEELTAEEERPRAETPERRPTPPPLSSFTETDISEALATLFARPTLAAIDANRRASAQADLDRALRDQLAWEIDMAAKARAAREADDEAALLLLL